MSRQTHIMALALAFWLKPARAATVSGTVSGDDGSAITQARVSLWPVAPPPAGRPRSPTQYAVTDSNGAFHFDGVGSGLHYFCVQIVFGDWLNPCMWAPRPPIASVPGNQSAVTVSIVLEKGVRIPVRVEDPSQLLAQREGKVHGAVLSILLTGGRSGFVSASRQSVDQGGITYSLLAPFERSLKVFVGSSYFSLSDAAGRPLPRVTSTGYPVRVLRGQLPAPIRLLVTGAGT